MQPNATQYTHYSTKCNTLQHALYQYNLGTRSKTKGHALTTAHNYNRKVGVDLSRMNHNQICHERGTGATRKVMLSPLLTITIAKSASICHEWIKIKSVTNEVKEQHERSCSRHCSQLQSQSRRRSVTNTMKSNLSRMERKNKNDRPCSRHCLELNSKVGVDLSRMNHNQICHERGTGATRKVMLSPLLTITICKVGVDLSRMKRDRIYHEWKKKKRKALPSPMLYNRKLQSQSRIIIYRQWNEIKSVTNGENKNDGPCSRHCSRLLSQSWRRSVPNETKSNLWRMKKRSNLKGYTFSTARNYNCKVGVNLSRMKWNEICHEWRKRAIRNTVLSPLLATMIATIIATLASICHE